MKPHKKTTKTLSQAGTLHAVWMLPKLITR
jgi:hypothetical protein